MYAYAHDSQSLPSLRVSSRENVVRACPRVPLNIDLNLHRDLKRTCNSKYCFDLSENLHYYNTDLNPFFHRKLLKPLPQEIHETASHWTIQNT